MTRVNNGYPLPDTIDPGSLVCIKTYVPDDALYIAAFWAAYQYLATWVAWERTGDTSGAQAAAVWLDAFKLARSEYDLEHACDWVPEPQYPEGDGAEELADYLWAMKVIVEMMDEMITDGAEYTLFSSWYYQHFEVWPGQAWRDTWDYLSGLSEAQRDAEIAAIPWEDVYNEVWCHAEQICGDGSYVVRFACWTQEVSAAIVNTMEDSAAELLNAMGDSLGILNDALGNDAINPHSSRYHGYGEYWDFDTIICYDWIHTWDFTTGQHDWTIDANGGYPTGAYHAGQGFRGVWSTSGGAVFRLNVRSPQIDPDVDMQKGKFCVDWDSSTDEYRRMGVFVLAGGGNQGYFERVETYDPGEFPSGCYDGEADKTGDQIWIASGGDDGDSHSQGDEGGMWLTSVTVWGSGSDPWE